MTHTRFSNDNWQRSNWGKTPRGTGEWRFRFFGGPDADTERSFHGTFTQAKAQAREFGEAHGFAFAETQA